MRRWSETRPRNCVLALFSADRVSAFIALRRARHKRVFAEGSGRFPLPEGSKSATRTSPALPIRRKRERKRDEQTGIRLESRRNIAFPHKSAPEKYASAEVYGPSESLFMHISTLAPK